MHTHLKGRIFRSQGTHYLVLQQDAESEEWVRVREVNAGRGERVMRVDEVRMRLGAPQPPEGRR